MLNDCNDEDNEITGNGDDCNGKQRKQFSNTGIKEEDDNDTSYE